MPAPFALRFAADVVASGGVIAYPTEGVYGLGCDPLNAGAVTRILAIKRRPAGRGLILIASEYEQLRAYLGELTSRQRTRITTPGMTPVTWIAPASPDAPAWITGAHDTIAVRVTMHPVAHALCDQCGHALVSTSANRSGRPAARSALAARRQTGNLVDYIVNGRIGDLDGPTPIHDLLSGEVFR